MPICAPAACALCTIAREKIIITRQTHHHHKIWKEFHPIRENEIVAIFERKVIWGCPKMSRNRIAGLRTKDPKCRILGLFQIKYGHYGWNFRGARLFFSSKYWFKIPSSEQQEKDTNSDRPGMKKNLWKNWDPNPKKMKKILVFIFFIWSLKKLKTYTYCKFEKVGLNFREENTKMQKCRFPEISKNFRMSKSVLFSETR